MQALQGNNTAAVSWLLDFKTEDGRYPMREGLALKTASAHVNLGQAESAEQVKILVAAGADPNQIQFTADAMGKVGTDAIDLFPMKYITAVARYVTRDGNMDNQMMVHLANMEDCTPLHVAAFRGNVGTVRALCQLGANPRLRNRNQQTPADVAQSKGLTHVAAELDVWAQKFPFIPVAKPEPSKWSLVCCPTKDVDQEVLFANIVESSASFEVDAKRRPSKTGSNSQDSTECDSNSASGVSMGDPRTLFVEL